MLAAAFLAAWALSGGCALTQAHDVSLADHNIHVRDVVNDGCNVPAAVGEAVIAAIPRDQTGAHLTRAALADLLQRRIPMLSLVAADRAAEVAFHAPATPSAAAAGSCLASAVAIDAGNIINSDDVTPVPCSTEERASLVYDRTYGLTRAGVDIASGAYLGHLSLPLEHMPDAGDALSVVAAAGAARVERPVTAAQPASRGGALFVRDADGHVFAAPFADANGGRAP